MEIKIINAYNNANQSDKEIGLSWYQRAHNECILLSQVFDLSLPKVVGVVAALSPNNKWNRNLVDAWNFLDSPSMDTKVCTYKTQRAKALRILDSIGSDEEIQGILNGPKTKNFYENILYYSTSTRVTVDLWVYRFVGLKNSAKNFQEVEAAFQEAASSLSIQPHQLQAVIWGDIRGKSA